MKTPKFTMPKFTFYEVATNWRHSKDCSCYLCHSVYVDIISVICNSVFGGVDQYRSSGFIGWFDVDSCSIELKIRNFATAHGGYIQHAIELSLANVDLIETLRLWKLEHEKFM